MSLNAALSLYESFLQFKFDRKSSKPIQEYDLRKGNVQLEGEVRFYSIDKMQFERIYNSLISYGFTKTKEEYQLKVVHFMNDDMSKIRCELNDLAQIREFCKTNILPSDTKYILKQKMEEYPNYYDNKEYQFRFAIQKEIELEASDKRIEEIQTNSRLSDKSFRYMNRVALTHPDMKEIQVDLSIVKSATNRNELLKEKSFSTSKLFSQDEVYEVEIELVNLDYILQHSKAKEFSKVAQNIQKTIRYVQCGIQNTSYPISKKEQKDVIDEYLSLMFGPNEMPKMITPSNFIGPSSLTLQQANVINDPDNQSPCILNDFCVTEKADGERRLCLIARNGRIYMIDTNMKVQYTGCKTTDSRLYASLLDGEFIPYGNMHKILDLYAAFDLYYYNGKNVRREPFYNKTVKMNRYDRLRLVIKSLEGVTYESESSRMKFRAKEFQMSDDKTHITECCQKLFHKIEKGVFEYENDGLIFTSMSLGVGMENPEDKTKNYKYTWTHSFKWKPPEFNTIDFLVQWKDTHYISSNKTQNTEPYLLAHLYVGHDPKQGMLNPQDLLFQGKSPSMRESSNYTKTLFIPSDPYDKQAYQAYLPMLDNQGTLSPFTENKEVLENDSIVEFKYVFTEDKRFRWVPLRVRYDKTADYRKSNRNFGNAYHVANSNWYSLYHPITKEMLCDESQLPTFKDLDQKIYYNRTGSKSFTRQLRNFHNLFVKSTLFDSVMTRGCTLIDYAVGKGGDLPKWLNNNPSFVFGIDISKDNIHNMKDGVCTRYLELKMKKRHLFDALFVHGDSSKKIMGEEFAEQEDKEEEEKSKFVLQQILGLKEKSKKYGPYIEQNYGVARNLFDVGSIQFAVHYMFKTKETLHTFMKNCSDTIKVGGYFIGTCYDGTKIFNELKDLKEGEKIEFYKSEDCKSDTDMKKIWSLTKKYSETEFPANESSLGMTIGVYQETINKDFDEYLVNFNYFIDLMKQYGFEIEEKMPGTDYPGCGNFSILYSSMEKRGGTFLMCEKEKVISFMNRYFVFKKIRKVDTGMVYKGFSEREEEYYGKIGKAVKLNKPIVLRK